MFAVTKLKLTLFKTRTIIWGHRSFVKRRITRRHATKKGGTRQVQVPGNARRTSILKSVRGE